MRASGLDHSLLLLLLLCCVSLCFCDSFEAVLYYAGLLCTYTTGSTQAYAAW